MKKKTGVRDIVMVMLLNFTSQAPVVIVLHTVFCAPRSSLSTITTTIIIRIPSFGYRAILVSKPCEQSKT